MHCTCRSNKTVDFAHKLHAQCQMCAVAVAEVCERDKRHGAATPQPTPAQLAARLDQFRMRIEMPPPFPPRPFAPPARNASYLDFAV